MAEPTAAHGRAEPGGSSRNFFAYLSSSVLTKLGDALSSPKTVLAWVMATIGAPAAMIALLVPIRESGSMLPQLALGTWVRKRPLRKPVWLVGCALQAASILGCAAAAMWLRGAVAGAVILSCVVVFSLARSLNSIAGKDVLGKTVPKGRRGRLTGWASGASGVLTLAVGIGFATQLRGQDDPIVYAGLLLVAGLTWVLAAFLFTAIREEPGETAEDKGGWRDAWSRLDLLQTDPAFRSFVATRALLMSSALSSPFYVALGREYGEGQASLLGSFLVAGGLASSLSAPIWGTRADRSSRRVMMTAGAITGLLGAAAFAMFQFRPSLAATAWTFPTLFFILGVAHAGVRAGRKTYVVDMAGGVKRTDYVSVSNTVIGLLLLGLGAITSVLSFLRPETLILGLALLALLGSIMAARLPEAGENRA